MMHLTVTSEMLGCVSAFLVPLPCLLHNKNRCMRQTLGTAVCVYVGTYPVGNFPH